MLVVFIVYKNIDLLNIGNPCNQNCRQCFYTEEDDSNLEEEIELVEAIIKDNPKTKIFVYPKEITTNMSLLKYLKKTEQKSVMTNGKALTEEQIIEFRKYSIEDVWFTMFADAEEQEFWNGNSEEQYARIKKSIKLARLYGLRTNVFTIVAPQNISKLEKLCTEMKERGVEKIELRRILPVGNAKDIDDKYLIREDDLAELITVVDSLKNEKSPRIYFSLAFGPDFYGNSVWKYLRGEIKSDWVATRTLCPTVNNNYLGISTKTGKRYWCFMLLSDDMNEGSYDFSEEALKENLRSICSKDNCEFQEYCLGGCRSYAYIFAKLRGEAKPEYAGMDICRTDIRRKKFLNKQTQSRLTWHSKE